MRETLGKCECGRPGGYGPGKIRIEGEVYVCEANSSFVDKGVFRTELESPSIC
jgi:hypothetical protein